MNIRRFFNSLLLFFWFLFLSASAGAETIDIMIVYDSTAKTWVQSNGGINLFAQDAVARMNQAMQDSGIDLEFNLVHAADVAYTHSDFGSDLDALQAGTGILANVHTWRNTYGADLVAMMVDTGSAYGVTGLGYLLSSYSGMPDYGFTVNAIQSVEISHTMTHETGHNLGAHHSKFQTSQPGPNSSLNTYSAGWYFTGTDGVAYHTIMAYDDDGYGNSYTEAPIFSSPLIQHVGTVAGDAEDGDNARCIRETMGVVAAYRTQSVDTFTVTATAGTGGSVTPLSRTVANGATASFTVTANSGYTKNMTVGGTCPAGSWSDDVYTTGPVTSDCTVSFSFTQIADDHGDDCASATNAPVFTGTGSVSVNGSLESEGDYDYFMIQLPSSGTLKVYTTGDLDTYGYLKASDCSDIAENDDGDDYNFMISESLNAGIYYVAVKGYSDVETGDYALKIEFTETVRYALSLSMTGTGSGKITGTPGSIDCSSACSYEFEEGALVTLTATASGGSTFNGWTGAYTGTQNPVTVTMDAAKSMTARFDSSVAYPLSLSMTGTGSGKITGTPGSIDCSSACSYDFQYGTLVTLTATASTGSVFKGWTGAYTGTQNPVTVTMDAAKSMTAKFDKSIVYDYLGSSVQNIYLSGNPGGNRIYTDFGGDDVYTVIATGMTGNIEVRDIEQSRINLPSGLTISAARFLSNGVQFTINGFTLTLLGKPELFTYVFAGTPLNPSAGVPKTFEETAQAFGTTVPASGQPANNAPVTGTIQSDGSIN